MRNIDHYRGDPLALYDAIVDAKTDAGDRREILRRLRPRIQAQYQAYEQSKTSLENLRPEGRLTKPERDALSHCYDSETAPLKRMKRDVLAALPREANKCPYCGVGEIGHGQGDGDVEGGWDHYLPRGSRPDARQGYIEFAVHPQNLIPCCAICNGYKSDRWREGSQRHFIHVYHDNIDQSVPLLEARIEMEQSVEARVTFQYAPLPYSPFFSLFKRHCEALDLKRRYARVSLPELASIRNIVQQLAPRLSVEKVEEILRDTAGRDARVVGVNHWKPTLYRAAARSHDFILHCLRGTGAPGSAANNVTAAGGGGQGA